MRLPFTKQSLLEINYIYLYVSIYSHVYQMLIEDQKKVLGFKSVSVCVCGYEFIQY